MTYDATVCQNLASYYQYQVV